MNLNQIKEKLKNKIKNNTLFSRFFGFESGIDITDDNQVLYRKNQVIKNIIFVSNMLYTIIFAVAAFGESSWQNWLLTILFFPITFFVNNALKKLIVKGPTDKMAMTIAMYLSCFYMFLSGIVVYIKLKFGQPQYLSEVGYILLYYSLTVCAFYQDKKLIKNIFLWVLVLTTVLHLAVTYSIVSEATEYTDAFTFVKDYISNDKFRDICLRSVLLAVYMVILYAYVVMANYMQDERKKELVKRRSVQDDFTNVVTKIFDVTLYNSKVLTDEDKHDIEISAIMSRKLASLLSYTPTEADSIYDFARIEITTDIDFKLDESLNEDERFEKLKNQTEVGSKLISRLQLSRKCEDIVRAAMEQTDNDLFIKKEREIQKEEESQIVLICELYVTLRSVKSYKRAYNHTNSISFMEKQCKIYFDSLIFDRFIKFASDFETIYDEI